MAESVPEANIAMPGLIASVNTRPVANALDGMAEAYATFAAALRAQQTGEFAMVMARLALDVKPNSATARLMAADIQANAKHFSAALALLEEAARTNDPIVPLIRLRHAAVLEQTDRVDEAIREVERIGRDYPDSSLPDIELGDLLRVKKRFAESVAAYDRVIGRMRQPSPSDWIIFYDRGIGYERTGQWTRAEADFNHALELSPDQPSVLNYLGYAWADMGRNLDRARDMIQRAAARRPNDGAITDSLGWVLFRQGNVAEATKMLERAVGLEPEDPTITEHLGDAYWATGRKIEAQYQWRRALTLNPAPEDAAKLEAKIKAHPFGTVASGK
jgi:tetratricopeptide (TPR) repeat protein